MHCRLSYLNSYSASHDNWCTETLWNRIMTAQCEGIGEVGLARYEPALLPPCPSIRVLCYSNCQRYTHSHQQFKGWMMWNQYLLKALLFLGLYHKKCDQYLPSTLWIFENPLLALVNHFHPLCSFFDMNSAQSFILNNAMWNVIQISQVHSVLSKGL